METSEYQVLCVPLISHRLFWSVLHVVFLWTMILMMHFSYIPIQREYRSPPGGIRREETHNKEDLTIFETQVLADLLMVTGMSKVKDAVSC